MNAYAQTDLDNWFVLATTAGLEHSLKKSIHKITGDAVKLYLPCRELCHRVDGQFKRVIRPIFPGYLFVYKHLETLLIKSRHSPIENQLHPVSFNNRVAKVKPSEMAAIFDLAGTDGVIKTSQARVEKDQKVTVTQGPLKNFSGQITYINRRKRKAGVVLEVLNRKLPISIGLEILQPAQANAGTCIA